MPRKRGCSQLGTRNAELGTQISITTDPMPATQETLDALRTPKLVKCVNRNGANERLGTVAYELDAILTRPLNHPLRLTGVLDLAGPAAEKEYLCFVVACLDEFRAGKMVGRDDDALAVMIFGALQRAQGVVSFKRVYRALNCKHAHLYRFTEGRRPELPLMRGSAQRRGPGGSAVVTWPALVAFIGKRRIA